MTNPEKNNPGLLSSLLGGITGGGIQVVDLTMTLDQKSPTIVLPPELGQSWPFRMEEISRYDHRGPAIYWNNISCGEHTGTHFDAPIHWISGKDLPNNATDTIPPEMFIAQACVIDCSADAAEDPDYLLTIEQVEAWEEKHGRVPPRSWLLMRTDWSLKSNPVDYLNLDAAGAHTPGPHEDLVPWLIDERDVIGFGGEAVGTDAGQAQHFNLPYPCHHLMHGRGRFGLPALTNLDKLPPSGSLLITPPLKIRQGSGSPVRVLALVEPQA
ncbi:MAG: cyclase family protein [Rhodospirillales bacterium]|jgi:kynurenine formamidase